MELNGKKLVEVDSPSDTGVRKTTWVNNVIQIPSEVKRYSKYIPKLFEFDFDDYGIKRGGLLESTLTSLTIPVHHKRAIRFKKDIVELIKIPIIKEILSTQVSLIKSSQIIELFSEQEKFLAGIVTNYRDVRGSHFRSYFYDAGLLSNGESIKDVDFISSFTKTYKPTKTNLISEQIDVTESNLELRNPLSTIPFENITDLEVKAEAHLKHRLVKLEDACWDVIEKHLLIVEKHKKLKAKKLPAYLAERLNRVRLTPAFFDKCRFRNETDYLHFILVFSEVFKQNHDVASLRSFIPASEIPDILFYEGTTKGARIFSTIYASYFLPRIVIVACQYIIQIHTKGWNPDVVRSIQVEDVTLVDNGTAYQLKGYKSKTGQQMQPFVFDKTQHRPFTVLKLLLEHNKNIDEMSTRESNNLLCSLIYEVKKFGIFNPKAQHKNLIERYNLPWFTPTSIRDQVINYEYLNSKKDLRYVKELLGHSNFSTVNNYLNHNIQSILSLANITDFMNKLAESIKWAVSEKHDSSIPTNLVAIFPSGAGQKNKEYLCDTWCDIPTSFEIGLNEIMHCILQRAYYMKNFHILKTENETRFVKVHLPRILFSIALYGIVSDSKYGFLLRKLEAEVKGY